MKNIPAKTRIRATIKESNLGNTAIKIPAKIKMIPGIILVYTKRERSDGKGKDVMM
ncbi:MAG: hypothetical protein ACMUJM_16905 [bacterium]